MHRPPRGDLLPDCPHDSGDFVLTPAGETCVAGVADTGAVAIGGHSPAVLAIRPTAICNQVSFTYSQVRKVHVSKLMACIGYSSVPVFDMGQVQDLGRFL